MVPEDKILRGPPQGKVPNISMGQLLLENMRTNRSFTLQINAVTGESITNETILKKSVKLADVLMKRGVRLGDRLAIVSENHDDWLVPACAILYVGGILTPLNPAYTEHELKSMLNISKPNLIFVSNRTERLLAKVASTLPWKISLIELDDTALNENVSTLKSLLESGEYVDAYRYEPVSIGDNSKCAAVILCSSGTTGVPKGVTLSHRNLICYLRAMPLPEYVDLRRNDRTLIFLPFYHGYAFGLMMCSMMTGSVVVILKNFNHEMFLKSVQKYQITHLALVPPILVFLAKHPMVLEYNFKSVREIFCGAAPLPTNLLGDVKRRLGVSHIRNGYGMTELTMVITLSDRSGINEEALSSMMPGAIGKVIDLETFEPLGPGKIGELCFKGDHVMLGYYGNRQATEEAIDKDGWMRTGDLGYYDEQKRIFVVDRLKELIKYKAYQVAPAEIEAILLTHPAVKDAAVVGKPDEVSGELPMAFIVKQPAAKVSEKELTDLVKDRLSPQKWLRGGVRFVDQIPKNPTGKILRRELRRLMSKL